MNSQVVAALSRVVARGYVADGEQALTEILTNIAHSTASGWVLSRPLLQQRQLLSDDQELVLALLGLLAEVRKPWLSIMAARCQEAGQMPDSGVLVQLITQLQGAAAWVELALSDAQLATSPHAAVERELLGVSLEQAAATPRLARILAASFALQSGRAGPLPAMPLIDASGMQANENWTGGRLLALPGVSADATYVLANPMGTPDTTTTMNWVFSQPWALLLAMVTYAQYNWAAEARGGLLLELSPGQNAVQPSQISVLVQGPEGDEMYCGNLAELILRVLDHLGMHCFPERPTPGSLDTAIASMIGPLLVKTVWRYQDGASGQNGQYLIHPDFADACFRLPGNKVFNRTGKHIWQAIRIVAEQWRDELRYSSREGAFN
ncbi:hypothetical protein ACQE3D_17455 [Methylomonas sp. MS20]|uniref:hypothetical protein n=1 Tax=Methylomonas sp. MS20 TaxID=3418769 RepID=UPI003D03C72B